MCDWMARRDYKTYPIKFFKKSSVKVTFLHSQQKRMTNQLIFRLACMTHVFYSTVIVGVDLHFFLSLNGSSDRHVNPVLFRYDLHIPQKTASIAGYKNSSMYVWYMTPKNNLMIQIAAELQKNLLISEAGDERWVTHYNVKWRLS